MEGQASMNAWAGVLFILKPVTDEQVFYDKFLYGKFYLPSARVYVRQILYDKFLVFWPPR